MSLIDKFYSMIGLDEEFSDYFNSIKATDRLYNLEREKYICNSSKSRGIINIVSALGFVALGSVCACYFGFGIPGISTCFGFTFSGLMLMDDGLNRLVKDSYKLKKLEKLISEEHTKVNEEKNKLIDELLIKEVRMPKHYYSLRRNNSNKLVSFNDLVNELNVEELKTLKSKMDILNDYYKYAKSNRERGLYNEDTISTDLNDDVTLSIRYRF